MHPPTLSTLVRITKSSAQPIKMNFRLPTTVTIKKDGTPVTNVDFAVQQRFITNTNFLHHVGYISEEGDAFDPECSYVLYVDPLDGTSAYMRGIAVVTVAVSLMKRVDNEWWEPISTVIYDPINDWVWAATKDTDGCITGFVQHGEGHYSPTGVRELINHRRVTAVAWRNAPHRLEAVREVLQREPNTEHQSLGATAIAGGLIASGLTDAVLFGGRSAVETAAMSLIVLSAGGVATDLFGKPLTTYKLVEQDGKFDFELPHGSIMSSCQKLTDSLVEIVKRVQ